MRESAENVVSRVLEPGENILWAGRPHVDPAMDHRAQQRRRRRLITFPIAAAVVIWMTGSLPVSSPLEIMENLPFEPKFLWVLAAPILLILALRIFKLDDTSRLGRHLRSLTYAITNKRLLILRLTRCPSRKRIWITSSFTSRMLRNHLTIATRVCMSSLYSTMFLRPTSPKSKF